MGVPFEKSTPLRSLKVLVFPSADSLERGASHGITPLPFGVTVKSGWVICSRIQIELLSKTVDSSIDCASCGLANVRLPPCTGPPLLEGEPDGDPLVPQPAMRARAEPAIRVFMKTMRCLTGSSRVCPGDGSAA